jgi:hypothetical protein
VAWLVLGVKRVRPRRLLEIVGLSRRQKTVQPNSHPRPSLGWDEYYSIVSDACDPMALLVVPERRVVAEL